MTTEIVTHVVDDAISNDNTPTALYVDDIVDSIHPVPSSIKRHISRAAVYQLLILQSAVHT